MAKTVVVNEIEVIFPEKKINDFMVKPFTFGQVGTALRIMTPYLAGVDLSAGFTLESINLNVLMYALTAGDCEGAFELCAMATGEKLESIKALPAADGLDLLQGVWDVAIKPTFELFKKKFQKEETKVEPETEPTADGQTSSSTLSQEDSAGATSTK
jgi:hypothetical protein